jgi:hypothetical protein
MSDKWYDMLRTKLRSRKAVSISMNTIVVAAIALVVLIVLIVVFSSRLGIFNRGMNDCKDKGGECLDNANNDGNVVCIRQGGTPIGPCYNTETGEKLNQVCCVKKT